jgi:hypothetical protein
MQDFVRFHARGLAAWTVSLCVLGVCEAHAATSAGCDATNRGSLNATVGAGSGAARDARLAEGETVTLTIVTKGKAALTVASEGDAGRRTLHSGKSASVTFVAARTASYGFYIDATDDAVATLSARCTSAAGAASERAMLDRRQAFLSARDPERIRIDRPSGDAKPLDAAQAASGEIAKEVTASVSMSELLAAMNPGAKKDPGILDFWFEGRYMNYDTGAMNAREQDGNFSVMYFGSKYMVGPDIMIGALAQFDQTGEALGSENKTSASGWMAGPYMSVRLGHGIVFDGRAAWGSAPQGVAVETASAERALLKGSLRGTRQYGGWDVTPKIGLSYVEDKPAYQPATAGTGSDITGSDSAGGTGRLDIMPEMKRRFDMGSENYIEPRVAAGGFLSFDDMSALNPATSVVPDVQWKAEAGVAVGKKEGMNLEATGGVETGAASAQDNWSGRFQLNMPLGN